MIMIDKNLTSSVETTALHILYSVNPPPKKKKKKILLVFLNLQLDVLLTQTTQTAMWKQEKDKHKSLSLQC